MHGWKVVSAFDAISTTNNSQYKKKKKLKKTNCQTESPSSNKKQI